METDLEITRCVKIYFSPNVIGWNFQLQKSLLCACLVVYNDTSTYYLYNNCAQKSLTSEHFHWPDIWPTQVLTGKKSRCTIPFDIDPISPKCSGH